MNALAGRATVLARVESRSRLGCVVVALGALTFHRVKSVTQPHFQFAAINISHVMLPGLSNSSRLGRGIGSGCNFETLLDQ